MAVVCRRLSDGAFVDGAEAAGGSLLARLVHVIIVIILPMLLSPSKAPARWFSWSNLGGVVSFVTGHTGHTQRKT